MQKIYIGETLQTAFANVFVMLLKLAKMLSMAGSRRFNLPNHSTHGMTIFGLSLHQGNTESRKNVGKKSFNCIPQTLMESMNGSHSTSLSICSHHHFSTNSIAPSPPMRTTHNPQSPLFPLANGKRSQGQLRSLFTEEIWPFSTCFMPNFLVPLPHRHDTTVSFEVLIARLSIRCHSVVVGNQNITFIYFLCQYFVLTSKGELKSEDNCLDYNGYDLYLRECDGLLQNQKWEYKVCILTKLEADHGGKPSSKIRH